MSDLPLWLHSIEGVLILSLVGGRMRRSIRGDVVSCVFSFARGEEGGGIVGGVEGWEWGLMLI